MNENENTPEIERDEYGFDNDGVHANGTRFDDNGFDVDGIHRDTDSEFSPETERTRDGSRRDSEGYDFDGYDREGFNRDGYDNEGYNEDGEDSYGHTRCDNGDCEDPDCETCHSGGEEFQDYLRGYSSKATHIHVWRDKSWNGTRDRTLYAGFELEMYADDANTDYVDLVLSSIDERYRNLKPQTESGRCAIAKHDSSLHHRDGGFECVTVPLTREQAYGIFGTINVLGDGRCSAWTVGDSIGHHIHVSRAGIGPLTLGKLMLFMNVDPNRQFLTFVAGRAAGYNKFEDNKKITRPENFQRHSVVNVTGATVEFRLFKCNLYGRAILKNYDFAMAVVAFCEAASYRDNALHYTKFLRWVAATHAQYPYLHNFLRSHRVIGPTYVPLCPANAAVARTGRIGDEGSQFRMGA